MKGKTPDMVVHVALFFPGGDHVRYSCKRSRRHVVKAHMHQAHREGGMKAARMYEKYLASLPTEIR